MRGFYMMKKRGQLSHIVIIEIVLLALITAAFFYFHKTVEEDTLFEKSYAARDMALLLETSQSVPGDIDIYYSQPFFDIGKYKYRFSDNFLRIYEGDNYLFSVSYPFFIDQQLYQTVETFALEHPAAFLISKQKGTLEIKEYGAIIPEEKSMLTCPAVSSTKTQKLSLVVIAKDDSLAKIETDFMNNPKIDFSKKNKESSAITEKTHFVLLLDIQSGTSVTISVPVADDSQSEKMGCLIANSILAAFSDAELEPVQKSQDELLNTNTAGLAVQIVAGKDILTDVPALSSAIKEGMEKYYE